MASYRNVWICMIVINIILNTISATPMYFSHISPNVNSRNIRHLPCVSVRTGETGVCMFAFDCVKANGTHLGTCLDRFYFGSCCKLNDEAEVSPQDNTIDDLPSTTFAPTGKPIESNDIPDYSVKPKPEKVPELSSTSLTRKPIISTPYTTTQRPVEFSTFQTVQDSHRPAANTPSSSYASTSSTQYQKVTTVTESTTKRTETTSFVKPPISSSSVDDRNPPATRFPPRNVTTTTQATTTRRTTTKAPTTTTQKILTTSKPTANTQKISTTNKYSATVSKLTTTTTKPLTVGTKRPIITSSTYTKKPTSPHRKPSTTPKPHTSTGSNILTTGTTNYTSTPVTKPTKPSLSSNSSSGTTVTVIKKPISESSTTTLSSTSRFTITPRPTSVKPLITSTPKPKPSSQTIETSTKPIKPATWTTIQSTEKPKPTTTSVKPTSKPRPTGKPGKPTKPSKPTTASTSTTAASTSTSVPSSSSIAYTTWLSTQTVKTTTTTTTTTSKPTTTTTTSTTTEVPSSVTPGLITWSSNSDDETTRTPSSTSTTTQEPEEITQTQWSPLTTPDGWVMIQSPSTMKPGIQEEPVTESKPTKLPPPTEPSTPASTTERLSTMKPTVPTVVSTPSSSIYPSLQTSTVPPEEFRPLNMSDYRQVCGRRMIPESRIVGGESSSFGRWPWQISLRQWRTSAFLHKCGAALLNENWAITAAHCVENVPPSDLLLRMGEHDLANEDEPYGFQERRVQIVASHPQFDPRTFEYDLALLRFYEPLLPFQPNLLPICLPDDDEGYVGHTAYVTGWGRLYEDGPLPSVLQEVPVPVINNTMCESMYKNAGYDERIPHIFICAGWRKGGFDSCEGDSGGPMVIQRPRDKRWILAGVISWGIGCAEPNQPGVYTRISEFREWITQILQF